MQAKGDLLSTTVVVNARRGHSHKKGGVYKWLVDTWFSVMLFLFVLVVVLFFVVVFVVVVIVVVGLFLHFIFYSLSNRKDGQMLARYGRRELVDDLKSRLRLSCNWCYLRFDLFCCSSFCFF